MFVKKSIFFYIPIVFVVVLGVLNLLFFTIYKVEKENNKNDLKLRITKAISLYQNYSFYNISYNQLENELKLLDFKYIKTPIKHKKYIYVKKSIIPFILEDMKQYDYNFSLYIFINLFLIMVFILLIRKLLPLKTIVKLIKNMPNIQNIEIPNTFYEIEEIIKAINESNHQINSLNESRKLFLRNIFHELLTPVTKIKLTSNLLKDTKQQKRIQNSLERLEYVIKELRTIETLISKNTFLEKKLYPISEILEKSYIISMSRIDCEIHEEFSIEVDINYFSIAIKNLIDNAYKYGKNPKIDIYKEEIIVSSDGDKLSKEFEEYIKPFSHSYENSYTGMGLGLYIVNEIVKLHNFEFYYKYENGQNKFCVKLW